MVIDMSPGKWCLEDKPLLLGWPIFKAKNCQTSGGATRGFLSIQTFTCHTQGFTVTETHIASETWHPKRKAVFQPSIFGWHVTFMEGTLI